MIADCQAPSWRRNEVVHSPCARYLDEGQPPFLVTDDKGKIPMPSTLELIALAKDIEAFTDRLNEARLHGFIKAALGQDAAT